MIPETKTVPKAEPDGFMELFTEDTERVLVVDDEEDIRKIMKHTVLSTGRFCETAENGLAGLEKMRSAPFDLVITDMVMPDMDGMALLRYCREHYPDTDVMVATGFSHNYSYVDVIAAGAVDFMEKPVAHDEFTAKLNRVFRERRARYGYRTELEVRKEAERKLASALATAEKANRLKDQFLANISHEMRTPLNGIIGFAELLLLDKRLETNFKQLGIILSSGKRLLQLVTDLIDIAEVNSKKRPPTNQPFNIHETVLGALEPFAVLAREKGVDFNLNSDDCLPVTVCGDREKFATILRHLASNAVKFTRHGRIEITVEMIRQEGEHLWVGVVVRDTGTGVTDGSEEDIFQPFVQGDGSSTRRYEGTGVGLTIAAGMTELMGGNLWLEKNGASEDEAERPAGGPGSVFHLELPFLTCVKVEEQARPASLSTQGAVEQ